MNLAEATALVERYGALQHPREVLCLVDYLQRDPPKLIVEVGVWRGGNAAILKTAFPDARLIGVDVLDMDSPEVSDAPSLRDAVGTFGFELVQGDTREGGTVDMVRARIGDQPVDYLFIDASHDTLSVMRDFEMWSPIARKVGFHDVHNPMVFSAWMNLTGVLQGGYKPFALWKEPDGHGIGIIVTRP